VFTPAPVARELESLACDCDESVFVSVPEVGPGVCEDDGVVDEIEGIVTADVVRENVSLI
jgi:hypothetical protein